MVDNRESRLSHREITEAVERLSEAELDAEFPVGSYRWVFLTSPRINAGAGGTYGESRRTGISVAQGDGDAGDEASIGVLGRGVWI